MTLNSLETLDPSEGFSEGKWPSLLDEAGLPPKAKHVDSSRRGPDGVELGEDWTITINMSCDGTALRHITLADGNGVVLVETRMRRKSLLKSVGCF